MGKKYLTKKLKKRLQEEAELNPDFNGLDSPAKDKKIAKEPRTKDTILSDIELQIVDMFSRSFTNGEIGVKYPQQKKKGMMRLMNFCFRTIIEEAELYIGPTLKKEATTPRCVDKRERTIFYLSSNYRYKHIEKSLLEDFKIVCKNFVKYHCLEHMDLKFLEKFYKKVIFNDFNGGGTDFYKSTKETKIEPVVQEESQQVEQVEQETPYEEQNIPNLRSPKSVPHKQIIEPITVAKPKTMSKRGRKKKNPSPQIQYVQQTLANQEQIKQIQLGTLEPLEPKTNKICIEKINIYLGYDSKSHMRQNENPSARLLAHPYARMQVEENEVKQTKRKWTVDMQSELIDQFMNSSATSPNIIIRNLMKKFGRNKLFVQSEINAKRKQMFKTSVAKFICAFEGKTLCSQEAVRKMEVTLKNMNLSPKNYFIAGFIHDFYFKEVQGISVTLLSEYVHKLSREEPTSQKLFRRQQQDEQDDMSITEKKKILERHDLKYALNTMSKIVANYNYD